MRNLVQGLRILRQNPGFAVTAILALALAIGANTAIFTFVDAMLIRPLPYPEPQRLVAVYEKAFGAEKNSVSPANWLDWLAQADKFEGFSAWNTANAILTEAGEPEVLRSMQVSREFFPLLKVRPYRGRTFTAADDRPNAEPVVIISYELWRRRFGGDEAVLGSSIRLNETRCRVIGIMPPGFYFGPREITFWQPYSLDRTREWRRTAGRFINVVARLKPDVTIAAANTQMGTIARGLEERFPDFNKNTSVNVLPLRDSIVGQVRTPLLILLAAVAALLTIGCFNVANMLLARTATRQREMAVRTALGASRWSIIRQLLGENLVLALAGGGLGVVFAYWMVDGLLALVPKGLIQISDVPIDVRVLLFALIISVLSCLFFGLAPAWTASAESPATAMHDGGRTGTRRMTALRRAFIVGQVALTVILLSGSALLLRSFLKLQSVDPGMDPRDLLTMRVELPAQKYRESAQRVRFFEQAIARIKQLPGVIDVTALNSLPIFGMAGGTAVQIQGQPILPMHQVRLVVVHSVMPGYFKTIKTRLVRGRDFGSDEMRDGAPPAFIVNEAFVRKYLAGQDPLNTSISVVMQRENPYGPIIGVTADIKQVSLDKQPDPAVFYSYGRLTYPGVTLLVRTKDQTAVANDAQRIIREIDPNQPLTQIQPMEKVMADSLARQRMNAVVVGAFAISALLLASLGIYGVLSYLITERTREIGVRMALGAQAWQVIRMVLAQGISPTLIGLGIGIGGSFAVMRLIRDQLFEVTAIDPVSFAGAAILLVAVALCGMLLPARRATMINPVVALRQE